MAKVALGKIVQSDKPTSPPLKHLLLPAALLLVLLSCSKSEPDYENSRTSYYRNIRAAEYGDSVLTCVTFNIHLGFREIYDPWTAELTGADRAELDDIARYLKMVDPDVVALQEVPLNRYNAVIKYFLDSLAVAMNFNYAFASHGYNDPTGIYPVYGEWGTAILSRFPVTGIRNVEVEYVSKWEKRSLLDAVIRINPATVGHFISLHWLPSDQGIPNTAAYLKTLTGPVVMMGDFNYQGPIAEFDSLGLQDADTSGIDRIFYSKNHFACRSAGVITDTVPCPPGEWMSDHSAYYAKLALP